MIGIGAAAHGEFFHSMAEATGGAVEMALPTEDMTAAVERMLSRMRLPALDIIAVTPEPLRDQAFGAAVRAGETIPFLTRTDKLPAKVPSLVCRQATGELSIRGVPWRLVRDRGLMMLAAKAELLADPPEDGAACAARYGLLTSETSFVLVNARDAADKAVGQPRLQRIPQMQTQSMVVFSPCMGEPPSSYEKLGLPEPADRALAARVRCAVARWWAAGKLKPAPELLAFLQRLADEFEVDVRLVWLEWMRFCADKGQALPAPLARYGEGPVLDADVREAVREVFEAFAPAGHPSGAGEPLLNEDCRS